MTDNKEYVCSVRLLNLLVSRAIMWHVQTLNFKLDANAMCAPWMLYNDFWIHSFISVSEPERGRDRWHWRGKKRETLGIKKLLSCLALHLDDGCPSNAINRFTHISCTSRWTETVEIISHFLCRYCYCFAGIITLMTTKYFDFVHHIFSSKTIQLI